MGRSLKFATCKCCSTGKVAFNKTVEVESGSLSYRWECANCGEIRAIGAKPKRRNLQRALIEGIRKAVLASDSSVATTVISEWKETEEANGDIYLSIQANQGGEGNLLAVISYRILGIRVSAGGAVSVYSDSKNESEAKRSAIAGQLRRGNLYVW